MLSGHRFIFNGSANHPHAECQFFFVVMLNDSSRYSKYYPNYEVFKYLFIHDLVSDFWAVSRWGAPAAHWFSALHYLLAPPTLTLSWPRKSKTLCYIYLIFHANCTHTKLSDSAAYHRAFSLQLLQVFWNDTLISQHCLCATSIFWYFKTCLSLAEA